MDDERRREINQENAQKSTGPRTEAGKARSSMNAVRHGILAKRLLLKGEDPAHLAELKRAMRNQFRPRNEFEEGLVERMIAATWRRQRGEGVELGLWDWRGHVSEGKTSLAEVFFMDSQNDQSLQKLTRYMTACDGEFYRALKTLRELQSERRAREGEEGEWEDDESESGLSGDGDGTPDDSGQSRGPGGDNEGPGGQPASQPASSGAEAQPGSSEAETMPRERAESCVGSSISAARPRLSREDHAHPPQTRWDDLTPEERAFFVVRHYGQVMKIDELLQESLLNPYRVERLGTGKAIQLHARLGRDLQQSMTWIRHVAGTGEGESTESRTPLRNRKGH